MISVIVPCYNAEKTLQRTIDSICAQSFVDWELVMIDDGSSDDTWNIIEQNMLSDGRIKGYRQSNQGLMRTWKNGVLKSTGDLIAFCDADDYYDSTFLEKVYRCVLEYGCDLVTVSIKMVYGDKEVDRKQYINGYYDRIHMETEIFPQYFHPYGSMNRTFSTSRCTKLVRKTVVEQSFVDLNDDISLAEDELATLTFVMNSDSFYVDAEDYLYNYSRLDSKMTGFYISDYYFQIKEVCKEIKRITEKYGYDFSAQISDFLAKDGLLRVKKSITMNVEASIRQKKTDIRTIIEDTLFDQCFRSASFENATYKERIFVYLVRKRYYYLLIIMTRIAAHLSIA